MSAKSGFTLVELLVVIAIMAIVGAYALSNYSRFGEDQKLKGAVLDIVSLLRQAQTNAATNVVCTGGTWQVEFLNTTTINLKCVTTKKTLPLTYGISVSGTSCPPALPFTVGFVPLTGKVNFISYPNCTLLTITLGSSPNLKSLNIEQGGRIYAQ
ncbi:MAG: type II secretion system protein [Candidatus Daviesbacteria bacterium]|nr:type II secretion system protein [Candidatus Daviesbacteria bacterium]